jgi:hypothetical protein
MHSPMVLRAGVTSTKLNKTGSDGPSTPSRKAGRSSVCDSNALTFDRAFAQRFKDPSEATMLRRIEETRYNTRYNGLRWPENGMTG